MERLAYAITDFLLRRQVIKQEEYEIYLYGYSVLLEQLLQVAGFIVLGFVSGNIWYTAEFLVVFHLLRSSFGGYHADTSLQFLLLSYGGWGAVMLCAHLFGTYKQIPLTFWVLLILDMGILWILGPVAHANKPLTKRQRIRNKRIGMVLLGIGALLAFLGRTCVVVDIVYIGTVTFVTVLAMVGKRKVGTKYEED